MGNELAPGTSLLERYSIIETISKRDFCNIYKAEDRIEKKTVAVKELFIDAIEKKYRDEALTKFTKEIVLYKELENENMAAVYNCFRAESAVYMENKQFIVTEYVEGRTLRQIKEDKKEKFSPEELAPWMTDIFNILQYLSGQEPPLPFYYFTPDHIMVTEDNRIKLINFGLGRLFRPGPIKNNKYMGIPGYAAPEQYGIKEIDSRADIFGLGAVLYYMLTEDDPAKHPLNFSPVRTINPAASMQLARFVSRCLQMKPEDRFASIKELKDTFSSINLLDVQGAEQLTKKLKPEATIQLERPKKTVGKEATGWRENLWWTVNKYIPAKYMIGIGITLLIGLVIGLSVIASNTGEKSSIIYLLEYNGKSVTKMNSTSGKVLDRIETGGTLGGIGISRDGKYIYITRIGNKLSIIDLLQKKEINSVIVEEEPVNLILSPEDNRIFVINKAGNSVSIIDATSHMIKSNIKVGQEPVSAVLAGEELYVCNYSSGNISIIDLKEPDKEGKTIGIEGRPVALAYNSSVGKMYVANSSSQGITVIDTRQKIILTNITLPGASRDIIISKDNKMVFVALPETKSIAIIDSAKDTLAGEISVKKTMTSLALSPDGKLLYVICPSKSENEESQILLYDTGTTMKVKDLNLGKNQYTKLIFEPEK